jgi:hypothetical protein
MLLVVTSIAVAVIAPAAHAARLKERLNMPHKPASLLTHSEMHNI